MNVFKTSPQPEPLHQLLRALEHDWQILEPVYPVLAGSAHPFRTDYCFILQRGGTMKLLTVPESASLREWIGARQLKLAS
jgi:hypothetical protein